jgi:uncharacterized protein (TIRG00374 family)
VKNKLFILLAKIAVGIALVSFIVWKMAPGWDESKLIIRELFEYRISRFLAGVACFGLVVLFGTYRWRLLLRAHQVRLAFLQVLKLFFVGHFFSQFMPGGIAGGDIVKSFYVSTHTDDRKHEAVTTIFIDRIIGVFGLFGVLVIAVIVNFGFFDYGNNVLYVLVFFGAATLIILLFFNKALLKKIAIINKIVDRIPYKDFVARIYNAFHYYKDHKFVLLLSFLLSTAVHLVLAAMVYLVASGLGLSTPFTRYLIIVSLVNFVGSVPISPLGTMGTLDGAYVYFFQSQATEESGIPGALALVIRLIYAFWGLVGLFVWLFLRSQMGLNRQAEIADPELNKTTVNEVTDD